MLVCCKPPTSQKEIVHINYPSKFNLCNSRERRYHGNETVAFVPPCVPGPPTQVPPSKPVLVYVRYLQSNILDYFPFSST